MGVGAATAMYITSALGAAGAVYGGIQQHNAAEYKADIARDNAADSESSARVHAAQIRAQGKAQASSANASYAGSGVEIGTGSALQITSNIVGKAEKDAWNTIFSGQNKARKFNQQAESYDQSAENSLVSSGLNAGRSALMMGKSSFPGWSKPSPTSGSANNLFTNLDVN